jgi:putative tryptophan/tyrosine transport system substrate-binding protein
MKITRQIAAAATLFTSLTGGAWAQGDPPKVKGGPAVAQVGWLSGSSPNAYSPEIVDAFTRQLATHGWVPGRNVNIVYRHAGGLPEQLPRVAAELVRLKVDVILASAPAAVAAAKASTATIPIVMVYGPDPAEAGLVASLSRPGGNLTGLSSLSGNLAVKQFELLTELVPGVSRLAILFNPSNPWHGAAVKRVEAVASARGIRVLAFGVRIPADLEPAFSAMASEHVSALLSLSDPMTLTQRDRLAELTLKHRLPIMSGLAEYTTAGGLASYWPDSKEMFRRAASYVHRILSGAKPGDLPIEQPTTYEFVINQKTAKALGLKIPQAVLLRVDKVVE